MSDYGGGWPTLAELRRVLDVDPNSTVHDETLTRALNSAIQIVKDVKGDWDDLLDSPTDNQAQAALAKAEFLCLRPEAAAAIAADARYQALITGSRRRFAIS